LGLRNVYSKEIEVSFPSSGATDYDFTRKLVDTPGIVPSDVALQVLSPCESAPDAERTEIRMARLIELPGRKDLIRRTIDAVEGVRNAILHLYLATSPCFQQIVLSQNEEQSIELAVACTRYARSITKDNPSTTTHWQYEFSPETFSDTKPDFAVRICEAIKAAWEPSESEPIIFNLPATVEMSTPNVYADQIEYFCSHITERETICVSLHAHNDRGCATAASELGQMAGAQRVEGTLFGNGERTGNVDLVNLALNLYSQGIHPGLDFSDINAVIDVVEESNNIPVHPRTPYGGSLVQCAFSGTHQDAIKKGFQVLQKQGLTESDPWTIPYLPLDPEDIGRTYEAIIRVNSQSGKGGVAWIIQRHLDLDLPRGLQIAFSKIVQYQADSLSRELLPQEIVKLFENQYHLKTNPRFTLLDYSISPDRAPSPLPNGIPKDVAIVRSQNTQNSMRKFQGVLEFDGVEHRIDGIGNGALSSLANAMHSLGVDLDVAHYSEHAVGSQKSRNVKAATYIECTAAGKKERVWGVGIHEDVVQASLNAMLSAASSVSPSPLCMNASIILTEPCSSCRVDRTRRCPSLTEFVYFGPQYAYLTANVLASPGADVLRSDDTKL